MKWKREGENEREGGVDQEDPIDDVSLRTYSESYAFEFAFEIHIGLI